MEAIVLLVAITSLLGAIAATFGADSRDFDAAGASAWPHGSDEDVAA